MSEQPLGNDEAARSPTGEILDASKVTETKPADTSTTTTDNSVQSTDQTTDKSGDQKDGKTSLANPDPKPSDKPPAEVQKPQVPETYADFKAPDGYTLDPKAIEAVAPIFKELGLTQDQAQELVDAQIARDIAAAKTPQATYEALRTKWQTDTLAHPDIRNARSGDKNGIDAVKAEMGRALSAIGDPALATEFKEAMDLTGGGDHPAIVRTFMKMASFITEGKHVSGKGPSPEGQKAPGTKPPTAAQAMYPNLPSAAG